MTTLKTTYGAVLVNDLGQILPNTVRSTAERCVEDCLSFYGQETWDKLQALGARVVSCEISVSEISMANPYVPLGEGRAALQAMRELNRSVKDAIVPGSELD